MLQPRDFPETRPSLLAAMRGDGPAQSAWRDFFERYAPAVFRVARFRGLDEADADDIVQLVMLAVSKHISGFHYDHNRGRFRQWVRRIAESKIVDHYRKANATVSACAQGVELLAARPDGRPTTEALWEQEWRLQDMLWCLDQVAADISPRRMQAFRMYVLEGLPAREVAERLDMTSGSVYVTRYCVLGLIRSRLALLEEEERGGAVR